MQLLLHCWADREQPLSPLDIAPIGGAKLRGSDCCPRMLNPFNHPLTEIAKIVAHPHRTLTEHDYQRAAMIVSHLGSNHNGIPVDMAMAAAHLLQGTK